MKEKSTQKMAAQELKTVAQNSNTLFAAQLLQLLSTINGIRIFLRILRVSTTLIINNTLINITLLKHNSDTALNYNGIL